MRIRILVALLAVGNLTGQTPTIYQQGEANYSQQVPLYGAPNQPIAQGRYTLSATIESIDGSRFTSTVPLLIQP